MRSRRRRRLKNFLSVLMVISIIMPTTMSAKVYADTIRQSGEVTKIAGATAFSMDQVLMTDPYLENALQLEVDYLLEFQVDKLLAGFRDTAGLDMKGQGRYGGWESSLIGGHTLGHYLTACSQAYINGGVSEEDKEALYQKITTIVDGLLECQMNTKGKTGFIFGANIIDRNNVEIQFDNVESRKTDIMKQAWVPWYTMHKIIAGLVDTYNFVGYEPAKVIASSLGDWTYNRASSWSRGKNDAVLGTEYGGMNDCLYDLYVITGKEEHAIAAHHFDEVPLFTKVRNGIPNALNGRHANTTIPKFLGGLKRYIVLHGEDIQGQKVDANEYLDAAIVFWDTVVNKHTYITGGNSEWEHFGHDHILDGERTNCNNETCNIFNMLKLSRELFKITGEKKYADYYENAFINSILSSQNPETGMTMYFQPMDSGYFKVYGSKFSHFWCCTGSGMENFTKLNDSVYYKKGNAVIVNMYLSSVVTWKEKNVEIIQESNIPNMDTTKFIINTLNGKNAEIELLFRVPDWATGDITIMVNDQKVDSNIENGYASIERDFQNGDVVIMSIPMEVVAYGLQDNKNVYGFKYGPVVLSAELGTKSMQTGTTGMNVTIPAKKILATEDIVLQEEVGTLEDFLKNMNQYLVREEGTMKFNLTGVINDEYTFTPHYQQHKQRYGIYWGFYSYEDSLKRAEEGIRFEYNILDSVKPGLGQYESDDLHQMEESKTFAATQDIYRYAGKDGWFTYQMMIDPLDTNYILLTYKKEDNGKTLRIAIDDTEIYSHTLNYEGDFDTYQVRIRIPNEVIDRKREIVIANGQPNWVVPLTFSGIDGDISARVCDMIFTINMVPKYDVDKTVAYFVDCGDHQVSTVSSGDAFGIYNSVTEQVYGEDPVTGYRWGLIDNVFDQYDGSSISEGVYTANTWCFEFDTTDGIPKTETNRYTKNQIESGIAPRFIDYSFELPNGQYKVEVGFSDPWSVSDVPTLYADIDKSSETKIAENISIATTPVVEGIVEVVDGELTLNFRSDSSAINVAYIKIGIIDNQEKKEVLTKEYEDAKTKVVISETKEETPVTTPPSQTDQVVDTSGDKIETSKSNLTLWIVIGVAMLGILSGGILLYWRKRRKSNPEKIIK